MLDALLYRFLLHQPYHLLPASLHAFHQVILNKEFFTVDAMHVSEHECTIFDIVLAFHRLGVSGHVQSGFRLNVALSRSKEMFMLVCDVDALKPSDCSQAEAGEFNGGGARRTTRF